MLCACLYPALFQRDFKKLRDSRGESESEWYKGKVGWKENKGRA